MAERYSRLDDKLTGFIQQQHIFFVGTAAPDGHVNISPKGMDTLRILGPNRVAWLNLTGSGNETAGHLRLANRMTLMFCSFERQPLILRLYGSATVLHFRDKKWNEHASLFPALPGARQIFLMDIDLVQTSCGYAVPHFAYTDERPTLEKWTEKKGSEGLAAYWEEKNRYTLDGTDTGIDECLESVEPSSKV